MSRRTKPVFVGKETYRRRRLIDAARLLPLLAVALMALPLLWSGGDNAAGLTTNVMIYLFGLWAVLLICVAGISYYLKSDAEPSEDGDGVDGRR